jgi:hypothetical protein
MTSDFAVPFELTGTKPTAARRTLLSLGDVFCFVTPALQFVQIQSFGVLQATDLVLLAALPVAVMRHPERLRQKPVPTILTLGVFWLISQVVTDFVRHSAPDDYLRGWSKIGIILVTFTVLWTVVCRSRRRFVLYGIGVAVGGILTLYVHPSALMVDSSWKFGLSRPVTILVVMGAAYFAKHRYSGVFLPLIMLAAVHSFENTRSLAVICVLTAIYCLFQTSPAVRQHRLGGFHFALVGTLLAATTWAFTALYSHYAEQGVFGEYAQRKLEAQTGEGGLLLGGRGEILASGQAILDSPILGHGSWARDSKYSAILAEDRAELGYKNFQNGKPDDLIPAHSHVFGAWVNGGLAGAVFWLFVLFYAVRSLMKVSGSEPLLPLFVFSGFMLLWDLPFSPISPDRRFVTPYFIVAMILLRLLQNSESSFAEET